MYIKEPHTNYSAFKDDSRVSPSSLNQFAKCPYYYWAQRVAKFWKDEDNQNFVLGGAADALITEGRESYEKKYKIVERRTPALKAEAMREEIELITPAQGEMVESMYKELERQPLYSKFKGGDWSCQEWVDCHIVDQYDNSSVYACGKMDYYHKSGIIADLKTCANLDTFRPSWYDLQMGMYHEMVKLSKGIDCEIYIIAVDKTDMTRSRIFKISEQTIEHGKKLMRMAIDRLKACRESNGWGSIELDDDKPHECATYDTCPYGIQKRIFII